MKTGMFLFVCVAGTHIFPPNLALRSTLYLSVSRDREFERYSSALTGRLEYEQTIDLETFDPNDIDIIQDETIRRVFKKVMNSPGVGKLGLRFLTDVMRSASNFEYITDDKKVGFEASMDKCKYRYFPDLVGQTWQRVSDVVTGRKPFPYEERGIPSGVNMNMFHKWNWNGKETEVISCVCKSMIYPMLKA